MVFEFHRASPREMVFEFHRASRLGRLRCMCGGDCEKQYLHTGLFARKDDYFIKVYRYKHIGGHMDEVEELKKTRVMSAQFEKRLQDCFQRCEKLFRVVY
jgi:hypothetical protein